MSGIKIPSIVAVSMALAACGPASDLPGRYSGSVEDSLGNIWACEIEIESTGPDRCHLHLDYAMADRCDGDGATILTEGLLQPDGGGELAFDLRSLEGLFYSALGEPYHIHAVREEELFER